MYHRKHCSTILGQQESQALKSTPHSKGGERGHGIDDPNTDSGNDLNELLRETVNLPPVGISKAK